MQKTICYIPVSMEDEMPSPGRYHVKKIMIDGSESESHETYSNGKGWELGSGHLITRKITHWLKPTPSEVYVLTKEELEELAGSLDDCANQGDAKDGGLTYSEYWGFKHIAEKYKPI